ncbi:MAG: type IX secretion system sortase PorU [Muribaculaceae bacterium]|nr:type IX secretion system sortase PorU [Muribaculaceae bacterium]
MPKFLHISVLIAVLAIFLGGAAPRMAAFDAGTYAQQSVLASGRWVKVSVDHSGLHLLPTAALRQWGFADPSRVRVYGYGGRRISDILAQDTYIDDLPRIASEVTDAGVVFYAAGPDTWVNSSGQYCHRESNIYTTRGYYFITEATDGDNPAIPATGVGADADGARSTGYARLHHEQDGVLASEAGALFVGEDFRFTPARSYDFRTPGRVADEPVWFECQFFHNHQGSTSTLSFSADGTALPEVASDRLAATSSSHYVHGSVGTTRHTFTPASADGFRLEVRYTPGRVAEKANLDYISVNYVRRLEMDATGYVDFWAAGPALTFDSKGTDTRIWDVTDPARIERVDARKDASGRMAWSVSRSGTRAYAAWRPGASLPQPVYEGTVAAQNLHQPAVDAPDMLILSAPAYRQQAQRIADLHARHDSLRVSIVDPALIYNEFSSGSPDVSGIRKYLKMMYDRGNEAGRPLRYVLLMGRTTLDHRMILESSRRLSAGTVPWWLSGNARLAMSDNDGYGTDDFIAMLADGSGRDHGLDDLCVAVGRIPLLSASEGDELIDKLEQYITKSKKTGWKNRLIVLADDEDNGVHLQQAERMTGYMLDTEGQQHIISKIYIDAYDRIGGTYPEARKEMFRGLEEGVTWWFFTGHANNHSWTGDGMLTFEDINSMYLRNVPFVVASTCDFLRWDSETISGGEIMYKERYGGAIGMISATRPVYISDNDYFLSAMGRHTLQRDIDGRLLTAGEIYRRAKNDIRNSAGEHRSNPNRLRFVFMGDPAMRPASPDNVVELLTINGHKVDIDDQITIGAMSNATLAGRIIGPDGSPLTDFDGVVNVELFDALRSVVTNGYGKGSVETFDTQGDKLYTGSARVSKGEFTLSMAMPDMVADNFRPATLSMYAYATNSAAEAIGANRDFYVYGFDEPERPDTIAPVIETMYLNHDGFTEGEFVNTSPMLIATLSDNVGINLSKAGIGRQITLTLDDRTTYADVNAYYTPSPDGSPSGTINYPFDNIVKGPHTLRLRAFDTSGNPVSRTISFTVTEDLAPRIFDVYTDANPASTAANFYVRHDRPENLMQVTVTVYDLMGHPVWDSTVKGMSDMDLSTPVTWDLTDYSGRRVQRGIYLYRASVTTDNTHYETASRRIAVTN